MKINEIQVGKNYRTNKSWAPTRTVTKIGCTGQKIATAYDRVDYTDDQGKNNYCLASTFARWAGSEVR